MNRAVFLDRDGVLNHNVFYADTQAYESPRRAGDFTLLPGVLPAVRSLQDAGFSLFLVSNQPNVAKGKSTLEELQQVHATLQREFDGAGIRLHEAYYCYHHPESKVAGYGGVCQCRKPSPYFLQQAQQKYRLDLPSSWMVGDRETDVECGKNAGVRTIRVLGQSGEGESAETVADYSVRSAVEAAALILEHGRLVP